MRNYRNTPLSPEEISIIVKLVDKWDSERQINSITGYSRATIRKYKRIYLERKRIADKLEEAMDKYYANTRVYRIDYYILCFVIFVIFGLAMTGLYFLINLY